ncbi:glycosyltransferase [Treponema sp.]|uniref:UDP-N-acetylglucosamine--N-acetylmuramyl- (pentapeptide) pyrophosphoryl-undecaprenol N-acetylglucosamine transferase n=1 Tax=Treponema sp. TaxID=166 RepID=UPI0025F271C3|nr:UDP-N-acetylglucosamine--N-acetylmuramyl-(pentapeptide) pyrophosphoryl-undecaprenol N-acetylglucosamine transferase [Treponema sp.]MCR5218012.1 UDP-N-acetylglucosamine--N-acetylmuramyl-(pentapeptide) pyrophosphoryl-undecaprenol N-acetylglucosamine transferase [Treponema sp.]
MKNKEKVIKIVFAGGGTGGHIYPGIAVADEVKILAGQSGKKVELYWMGNSAGMDRGIVEKNLSSAGGSIDAFIGIPSGKLRRYFSFKNFLDIFKIGLGFIKSIFVLIKIKPDCLFSKGGFVSVPPCRAARLLKIPYFTHECDFTPGLATRLNAGGAKNVFVSYEDTKSYFKGAAASKCIVTGNPVRPVFYEDRKAQGLEFLGIAADHKKPVLLVLGGSLGATQVNNLIVNNLDYLKERFIVVHQTGKAFADANPDIMNSGDDSYKPYAFIYGEMPAVIQSADVIVARAGANSLWECAVCGKPMVLIPLCGSGTRGDQVDNARYFEEKGAALVLAGEDADDKNLKEKTAFFLDEEKRKSYSSAALLMCGQKSAFEIAERILKEVDA